MHSARFFISLIIHFKKAFKKSSRRNLDGARSVCNLHTFYNVAPVYIKKKIGLLFSQSEARNFFTYIITHLTERLDLIYSVLAGLSSFKTT